MKTKLLFLSLSILITTMFVSSCTEEKMKEIIDFNVDNIEYLTTSEKNNYTKALDIINSCTVLKNNRYIMNVNNGYQIGVSERVFSYFKYSMEEINKLISELESKNYKLIQLEQNQIAFVDPNSDFNLGLPISRSEDPSYGTSLTFGPVYVGCSISCADTQKAILATSGFLTYWGSKVPNSVIGAAVSGFGILIGVMSVDIPTHLPNGIQFSIPIPSGGFSRDCDGNMIVNGMPMYYRAR